MLIHEHGDGFFRLLEYVDDLLKELGARIQDLVLVVSRVFAVFDDHQDAVHIGAADRVGDRLGNRNALLRGQGAGQILHPAFVVVLVVELANDLKRRLVVLAVHRVTVHEPPDDVIGVRQLEVRAVDSREPLAFGVFCPDRPRQRRGRNHSRRRSECLATIQGHFSAWVHVANYKHSTRPAMPTDFRCFGRALVGTVRRVRRRRFGDRT